MLLLVDNGDSFSYSLMQMIGGIHAEVRMFSPYEIPLDCMSGLTVQGIVLSSGMGEPRDKACSELIGRYAGEVPILGIGLGQHRISSHYGGRSQRVQSRMYGKSETVLLQEPDRLFEGVPGSFDAAVYNALRVDRSCIPPELQVIAEDRNGEVYALKHKQYSLWGIQFHPESVLTPCGEQILRNFLALCPLKESKVGGKGGC